MGVIHFLEFLSKMFPVEAQVQLTLNKEYLMYAIYVCIYVHYFVNAVLVKDV